MAAAAAVVVLGAVDLPLLDVDGPRPPDFVTVGDGEVGVAVGVVAVAEALVVGGGGVTDTPLVGLGLASLPAR